MLKAFARSLAGRPALARVLWQSRRDRQVVVMMHRFADADAPYVGHDPQGLRALLAYLRKSRVTIESVDDMARRVARSDVARTASVPPAIAFTVDDGYGDVATLAQPVFEEFDCPFTVFVVPEVVDGNRCFWWDQLAFMMGQSRTNRWVIPSATGEFVASWSDEVSAFAARKRMEERIKRFTATEIDAVLRECARQADVPLFSAPPPEYGVLSWSDMRGLEERGVRFGAHSMTHAALSTCADDQAQWEIAGSLERVRQELRHPSSLFCYPYGKRSDFSERDERLAERHGCIGAI
ncbi:polysaccharide deacetylase family protein, partial [Gemmatimonas sp.]|uniref:polysaccharide deacetylase family protein n=1 Tax=Gemmatimonas sp. TaxID=1962908 RepID=UPI0037BE4CFF